MLSATLLLSVLVLCRALVLSKLGRVLTAIRDAEDRVRFCGYDPVSFKLFVWTLSAAICGIAGALYVPQVGIINPSEMSPANSVEIAIAVAVGGRGTLLGPILGAALLHGAKSVLTVAFPELWLFVLGLSFIVVTRWLPRGVLGLFWREEKPMNLDTPAGPVLYLSGVTVTFDGFKALDSLCLLVEPGELRCIIGPNGAGKTTLMDVITGRTRPDAGDVQYGEAHDLTRHVRGGDRPGRHRPQVPEAHHLPGPHRVREPRAVAEDRQARASPRSAARRTPGAGRAHRRGARAASGSGAKAEIRADLLSHGEKQWLEIGMLLVQDPGLLLLDEPVAGMSDEETGAHRRTAAVRWPAGTRWWWWSTTCTSWTASPAR